VLQIRRAPSTSNVTTPPDVTELEIGFPGNWRPFLQWVAETLETREPDTTLTQEKWWKLNGLAFCPLNLPRGLRDAIYGQITSAYVWPHTARMLYHGSGHMGLIYMFDPMPHNVRDSIWMGVVRSPQFQIDPLRNRPPKSTALISTNKQVNTELVHFAHQRTNYHFQD
jgi:hypothetical protein